MSDSRERILASIRKSLRRSDRQPESVRAALAERLTHPRRNVLPRVDGDLADSFTAKLEAAGGRVTRVASLEDVAGVVIERLESLGQPLELVAASDPGLDGITWSNRVKVERREARDADRASVNYAFAGVAETGTSVLLSAPDSPTTLNFLPEDHFIVVARSRLVRHLEDAFDRLRAERPEMPRTVNCITGPSKTGDVEITIQEGAHGPKRVHAVLVETA